MLFPLTPEEDAARLPVAVLTGFLGSGKTTLVNRLLRDPRMAGTAVAVNEFGEVPIDGQLIGHGAEQTVVLANGCLCCTLSGEMEEAVMRLFARREEGAVPGFRRLLVEPSGLADPGPIAQAVLRQPALSRVLRLEGIVAVVDAQFGERQLAEHPEARRQVELADLCVVTKGDLAETVDVRAALGRANAAAPVIEARHGEADAAALFSRAFLEPGRVLSTVGDWFARRAAHGGEREGAREEVHGHDHGHAHGGHGATSVSLLADVPLRWEPFERWLRAVRLAPGEALLRVKGILDVRGRARPVVVQGVRHVLHPPAELEAWPEADGPGGRRSCLVLIGRGGAGWAAAVERGWREALPGMTEEAP